MDAGSPAPRIGVARRWSQPAALMPIEGPPSWSSRGRWPSCGPDANQGPAFVVVSGDHWWSYGPSCRGVQVVAPESTGADLCQEQRLACSRLGSIWNRELRAWEWRIRRSAPAAAPSYANDDAALRPAGA
jgi:hypothetical protein